MNLIKPKQPEFRAEGVLSNGTKNITSPPHISKYDID
jgi:hypothetical protein